MEMGKKIKFLRIEQDLSAADFAEKAGVHTSTLSRIENGVNNNTSYQVVVQIAEALGVSLDWLTDDDQGYPPPDRVEKKREKSRK